MILHIQGGGCKVVGWVGFAWMAINFLFYKCQLLMCRPTFDVINTKKV